MTTHATVQRIYVDRSRIESYQRCPRRRFLEYHQDGTGITTAKTNIYFAVGGAVHRGLEIMLRLSMGIPLDELSFELVELKAVQAALDNFAKHSGALELDSNELAAMTVTVDAAQLKADMIAQAQELGMDPSGMGVDREQAMSQFERMLFEEQSALVEAMVRAYARYKLRPLLEQFEVLEVEREGEWQLSQWAALNDPSHPLTSRSHLMELVFMSRLDALLRERATNQLFLQSYKTTGTWGDIRRLKAAEHDVQGLTEGIEVENRLQDWWVAIHMPHSQEDLAELTHRHGQPDEKMIKFLQGLQDPPRIFAVRYEYLLKGERWEDKELSAKLGMTVRTQRSPLIRQYVARSTPARGAAGYTVGDVCWSWEYTRVEDDKDSKLAWQSWSSESVWDKPGGVKAWIDQLADSTIVMSGEDSTVGMEPRPLGWKSDAQKLGVTKNHPFEDVFPPPVIVTRNDDELRDVVEQIEAQERHVAEKVEELRRSFELTADLGARRSFLNVHFPQHRHSCFYPVECWATKICYATSAFLQADPLGAGEGKFVRRVPNHPQENQK